MKFNISLSSSFSVQSSKIIKKWLPVIAVQAFLLGSNLLIAQNNACSYIINGKVLDEDTKELLPFVTVRVSGSEKYATTDENGFFKIEGLCSKINTLIISCVGYCKLSTEHHCEHGKTDHIKITQEVSGLEEVTIVAKKEEKKGTTTIAQQKLNKEEIRRNPTNSLAEAISIKQGVTFTSTGTNAQRPVIHGLSGNRILILNNDLKHGFQNWGNDHAPEIDITSAHSVTIVKGASGVRFGPEALAGAVIIESNPLKLNSSLYANVSSGFQTNGKGVNGNLEISHGLKNFSYFVNGNYTKIGDRKAPGYNLTNSGKEEKAFSLGGLYHYKNIDFKIYYSFVDQNLALLRSSFFSSGDAFSRAIKSPRPLIIDSFSYDIDEPNQLVQHHLAKAEVKWWYSEKGKITFIAGRQNNSRKEFEVRRNAERPIIDLELISTDLQLEWDHPSWSNLDGLVGIQAFNQDNDNNPGTGVTPFIPNYNTDRYSAFVIEKLTFGKNALEAGIRFDHEINNVRGRNPDESIFRDIYRLNNVTASLGYKLKFSENNTFRSNIGTAWRTPNIAELYSFGQNGYGLSYGLLRFETDENDRFSTDNVITFDESDVNPEVGYKFTNEFQFIKNEDSHLLTFYSHYIKDYIFERPLGVLGTFVGPTPASIFAQADSFFAGIDYTWRKDWSNNYTGTLGFSFLWSKNISDNEPLFEQAPISLNYEFLWKHKKVWKFDSSEIRIKPSYTFQQFFAPRTIDPDNLIDGSIPLNPNDEIFDFIDAPSGYFLLDIGWRFKYKQFNAGISVNNVLNTSYRSNLNQLRYFADEIGTNVLFNLSYSFTDK